MTENIERCDSIELSRTAKGVYSWKIKLYFNREIEHHSKTLIEVNEIDDNMKERFGDCERKPLSND